MEESNTPALQELGQKVREEKRIYVPRETRDFNKACDAYQTALTCLMTYSLDRKNPKNYRDKAANIFKELFSFNDYYVNSKLLENDDPQQPELFPHGLPGGD